MAFDKDAFLTALDSMTVMELNDLVKGVGHQGRARNHRSGLERSQGPG
jgi:ribosomal protein L7/L12